MKQHVQLQINEKHTYSDIKAFVQTYEMTTSTWSTARVHSELGVVGNSSVATGGATPMEVDAVVWKGSGKGKNGKDGYKGKGKSKDKGKGKYFNGMVPKRAKAKAKILPKENQILVVAAAKAMVNPKSLTPISAFTATALVIESFSAESIKQTRQLEVSDKFMMKLIVQLLVLLLQEPRLCPHLQVFQQLDLQVVQLVAIRALGRSQVSLLSYKT